MNESEPIVVESPCEGCGAFSREYVQREAQRHYEEVVRLNSRIARLEQEIARKDEALREIVKEQEEYARGFDPVMCDLDSFGYNSALKWSASVARTALFPIA